MNKTPNVQELTENLETSETLENKGPSVPEPPKDQETLENQGPSAKETPKDQETLENQGPSAKETPKDQETTTIRHLVLAGGGSYGFITYGVLKETNLSKIWSFQDIETIYGTSVGSILGVILLLGYEWSVIDDYLIKRPWHNVVKYDLYTILGAFEKRGIFNIPLIENIFSPLFKGMDISMDITMLEFYEMTKKELHIFATDIQDFKTINISHRTHPEWRVIDAVYASCCLPIIFAPFSKDGRYYADGGLFLNYPIEPCITNCIHTDIDSILGINKLSIDPSDSETYETMNLMDYTMILLRKLLNYTCKRPDNIKLKHEIIISAETTSIAELLQTASSVEKRSEWIKKGEEVAKKWISNR